MSDAFDPESEGFLDTHGVVEIEQLPCTGGYECKARYHIHGCFADAPCQHGE